MARQIITQEWWTELRDRYDLYSSQLVIREASSGSRSAARKRLAALAGIPLLKLGPDVISFAQQLVEHGLLPAEAADDAVHIAAATMHGMEFLLTWNLRHIANAEVRRSVAEHCARLGLQPPTICTPEELTGR